MAKRLLEPVDSYHDTHQHHIECPRCGRHSVVLYGEGRYVCLNCRWERDIARGSWGDGQPPILVLLALFVVIAIVMIGG